jgi:protoheme IX farnesyltransferase
MSASNTTFTKPRTLRDYMQLITVLFKLRVVSLLLMAAVGGAFLGAQGWPGMTDLAILLLTGGMAAAGSSSLNQYWEREKDKKMSRTRHRPLPTGVIEQRWVPIVGLALIFVPSLAVLPFNPWLTFWLLFGAFIYVVVYTIWLKPRTLLNVVIGGAAGSAAVMSGGAAVFNWDNSAVIVLALVLFVWSPCHFWSLAIMYRDDYERADVPMLPTKVSPKQGGWWVLSHTIPTVIGSILLTLTPSLGWLYFIPTLLVSADLVRRNIHLIREPSTQNARSFFMGSNYFLTVLLAAIYIDTIVGAIVNYFA